MIKHSENPIHVTTAETFIQKFISNPDLSLTDVPANISIVKTGHGRQNSPLASSQFKTDNLKKETAWFNIRTASLFRKLVIKTDQKRGVSIGELRNVYGGSKNRGVRPSKHVKGSKYVIGLAIKNLRDMGLVDQAFGVTEKGMVLAKSLCESE